MLISEQIVADKNFLKIDESGVFSVKVKMQNKLTLLNIYKQITESVKVVVPDYLLDYDSQGADEFFLSRCRLDKNSSKEVVEKRTQELRALHTKYAKLPFQSMTIECDKNLVLLVNKKYGFKFYLVDKHGYVCPVNVFIINPIDPKDVPATMDWVGEPTHNTSVFQNINTGAVIPGYHSTIAEGRSSIAGQLNAVTNLIYYILTHLNVSNRKLVEVTSNRIIPVRDKKTKVITTPSILYKVLILDKSKPILESMDSLEKYIQNTEAETRLARAAIVRGHFKQRRTGLFWWSDFVRNYQNALTIGIVDKTYSLKA